MRKPGEKPSHKATQDTHAHVRTEWLDVQESSGAHIMHIVHIALHKADKKKKVPQLFGLRHINQLSPNKRTDMTDDISNTLPCLSAGRRFMQEW